MGFKGGCKPAGHGMHGGPPHEQGNNSKVPPAWSPEWESQYPLWVWAQDLNIWTMATELPPARQGPAVVMQLGGTAKIMCREMDTQELQHGINEADGNGGFVHTTGVALVLRLLILRFGELEEEKDVRMIAQLFTFSRAQGENIDQTLTRFDLVRHRLMALPGFAMGSMVYAWMLLTSLRMPPTMWTTLLAPLQGRLPIDDEELSALKRFIRKQSHLIEKSSAQHDTTNETSKHRSTSHIILWS